MAEYNLSLGDGRAVLTMPDNLDRERLDLIREWLGFLVDGVERRMFPVRHVAAAPTKCTYCDGKGWIDTPAGKA